MSSIIKKNQKGDAMIVVLCIMAILVTLAMAMLLAASVLINNAQGKFNSEQCRLSAVSMSQELEEGLLAGGTDPFYQYIKDNLRLDGIGGWPYYNPDEVDHGESANVYKDLVMSGADEAETGKISLRLYWTWDRGGFDKKDVSNMELYVGVTAEKGGQKYTEYMRFALSPDTVASTWQWNRADRKLL